MKKQLNLLCSVIALFCVISMYMPIVAPRYPAKDYYAPSGSYERDYYYDGDYYLANEYWSITRYTFSSKSVVGGVILTLTQALLMVWAWMSVRGEAGKLGLIPALLNLLVVGVALVRMLGVMWCCRWGVIAILVLVALAAVALAIAD